MATSAETDTPSPICEVPTVAAVAASAGHHFSKQGRRVIRLVEGLGVEGDGHLGRTVQHVSRVRRDPSQPNLRQVHLIPTELFDEVGQAGHVVHPGDLGENVTTTGIDVFRLPTGTVLRLGEAAEVLVTGLRNPCRQIEDFQPGLLKQVLGRDASGRPVRRAGIMGVVRRGGEVRPGDEITLVLPPEPHRPLELV